MGVVVVFDPNFGSQREADLADAFWLIASLNNRALAARAWASGTTDANSAVFQASDDAPNYDEVLARLEDVDEHQPTWTEIILIGVPLTNALRDRLAGYRLAIASGSNAIVMTRQLRSDLAGTFVLDRAAEAPGSRRGRGGQP